MINDERYKKLLARITGGIILVTAFGSMLMLRFTNRSLIELELFTRFWLEWLIVIICYVIGSWMLGYGLNDGA